MKTTILVAGLYLVMTSTVRAAGGLQFEGTIAEVDVKEDELSFLLTGELTLSGPTAPEGAAARAWQSTHWTVEQLPVRVSQWNASSALHQGAPTATFQDVTAHAMQVASTSHVIRATLDDPTISFSSVGEPSLIEGSRLSLQDVTALKLQAAPAPPTSSPQSLSDRRRKSSDKRSAASH